MAIASLQEVGWALSRCQPLAGTSQRENPCRQSPCYIVSGLTSCISFSGCPRKRAFVVVKQNIEELVLLIFVQRIMPQE